ncbi:MAG: hypothetical protein ACI8UO_001196 [Verrucomicrobiales bacterium]|jgi:hypothetical protein
MNRRHTRFHWRAFAASLFILASPLIGQEPSFEGKTAVVVGQVTVTPNGGAEVPLKIGDIVAVGSTIKTGPNSRAVIATTRQSAARIGADTEIVFEELDDDDAAPKVLLDLKSGSMGSLIQPQSGVNLDFRIRTPSGIAGARGTFFAVAVENGEGFIQVKEGKVAIKPDNVQVVAPQAGRVSVVFGDVRETPEGGAERALQIGDFVKVGSVVKTGDNSRTVITMTKSSAVRITANSETEIAELDEAATPAKVLVDLKQGAMGALVDPQAAGKIDFRIKTPSGIAAARGTFFSVAVEGERGFVLTKEGRVVIDPAAAEDGN